MNIAKKTLFVMCISLSSTFILPAQEVQAITVRAAEDMQVSMARENAKHAVRVAVAESILTENDLKVLGRIEFKESDLHGSGLVINRHEDEEVFSVSEPLPFSDAVFIHWSNEKHMITGKIHDSPVGFCLYVFRRANAANNWTALGSAYYYKVPGKNILKLRSLHLDIGNNKTVK